jgi:hypothetical protein
MVYINECIDVNTALKNSFKSMSCSCFQEISYAGKPQVVSRYILQNYGQCATLISLFNEMSMIKNVMPPTIFYLLFVFFF